MAEAENAAVARRWFDEVWKGGGESTVHELLHRDGVGHMEGLEFRGAQEFLTARAALLDAFPDMDVRADEVIAQGDSVAVRWSVTATHAGDGLGIRASQQRVAFRGMTWLRFSEGQIVEGWDAWNQGRLMTDLQAAATAAAVTA